MCAALSGRRGGQLPQSVMAVTYGDTTGMSSLILVAWVVAFPVLAIALDAVPVSLAAEHGTQVLFGCLALRGLGVRGPRDRARMGAAARLGCRTA